MSFKGHNRILSYFSVRGSYTSKKICPATLVTQSSLNFKGGNKTIGSEMILDSYFTSNKPSIKNTSKNLMIGGYLSWSDILVTKYTYLQFYPKIYSCPKMTIVR